MTNGDDKEGDVPMDQLFERDRNVPICLVAAMFAQGMSHNMMFAHLEDLNVDLADPRTRASLGSAFLGANGTSNLLWGPFCDRYGQKAGILWSLIFQSIGAMIMAFAGSLSVAIIGRAMCGISANVTLTRAYAGRTSNGKSQAKAYSWIIGAFGAAVSMVPLCAWIPNEYNLPNSAAATSGIVAMVSWATLALCCWRLPYLPPPSRAAPVPHLSPVRSWSELRHRAGGLVHGLWLNRLCFLAAFSYTAVTFLLQAPDHVLITQTVLRPSLKWLFSIQGFTRMVWTLFAYPRLCRRYDVVRLCKFSMAIMVVTVPSVYLTSLINNILVRHLAEVMSFMLRGIILATGLTSGAVLVNNASPARLRTTITGLSQSAASLTQTGNVALLALMLADAADLRHAIVVPYLYLTLGALISTLVIYYMPPMLKQPIYVETKVISDLESSDSLSPLPYKDTAGRQRPLPSE